MGRPARTHLKSETTMSMETDAGVRRVSPTVDVGGVLIGSEHPVVVQSMTNTDTEDIRSTATQIAELARAGSELVRITVNTENAAASVAGIMERLEMMSCNVPVIGDFHYNGHRLLQQYDFDGAITAFERLLEIKPNAGDAKPRIEMLKEALAKSAV